MMTFLDFFADPSYYNFTHLFWRTPCRKLCRIVL